ncbi:MAG: hypothetical protein LBS63_02720, partial [Prevotellaceae bacterium]|nr:hypothetical protein [Prevotellaceae bacterium]
MFKNQHIAIVTGNGLLALGLETLLGEYASPASTLHFATAQALRESPLHFALAFIDGDIYAAHAHSIGVKNKILLLPAAPEEGAESLLPSLYLRCGQQQLAAQLELLLPAFGKY